MNHKSIKKVLVLGSGALKIGEAGEFDYSGSQALKAFKEEGVSTVLVNPNIATIQTSKDLADKIYFLPVTSHFVTKVIEKELPGGILISSGGQTALNCGLDLFREGILQKYRVQVLGSPIKSVEITEDRKLFSTTLRKIGIKVPLGGYASSVPGALNFAKKIGFPLIVRSAFSLGGLGSSVVTNTEQLKKVATLALSNSPQISIEEYLKGWKEIEYEIVRDGQGNKISVCNMENFDPLGVHTGESIVVAPSQTLNNYQYHFLRNLALKVIEYLGIVGECNIQFGLDPKGNDYRVIEVNARLSRSSALASKATGYPLAYIAAKLSLGHTLPSLKNNITKSTSAFFEPSLDYIVVKVPKWDLQKFIGSEDSIGPAMKSVGEVMGIGRVFPEALQKAVRMLDEGYDGLLGRINRNNGQSLKKFLSPSTKRLFAVARKLYEGISVERISRTTGIDPWFLFQIQKIVHFEKVLGKGELNQNIMDKAKKLGFSDRCIARAYDRPEIAVRSLRKKWDIIPLVRHIDTLAAEYPAKTNYLYLTYHGQEDESERQKSHQPSILNHKSSVNKVVVLGSGPYRIGSSVEFDWCCVTAASTFRKKGIETVVVNCNPETVSTDFDIADKLYFEELTFERVSDIYEIENTQNHNMSLVLAFGGQIPNTLAKLLSKANFRILGTNVDSIDSAEDREKFSALLDTLKINQPAWDFLKSTQDALKFARKIGFPVLVRPSYVLSGSAMNIAFSAVELKRFLKEAAGVSREHPVVISKFIDNAKEIEIDGVAKNGSLLLYAISEHIENAGVHSGDATLVLPPQRLYLETMRQIKEATRKIIKSLKIHGPFNIQFLAKDNKVMVIELNLRSSRSFPFVSKVTGYNFVEVATSVMVGEDTRGDYNTLSLDWVAVKAPQFSFNRIKQSDPKLRVEMSSTGEVACFGQDHHEAYLKALLSTGWRLPEKAILLSIGGDKNKVEFTESMKKLENLGLRLFATEKTSLFLQSLGIRNRKVFKISEKHEPSVLDLITSKKVDLTINISVPDLKTDSKDGFIIRRSCIDFGIPLLTNLQAAIAFVAAISEKKLEDLEVKSWDEYLQAP